MTARSLYQQALFDLAAKVKDAKRLPGQPSTTLDNPLCGDRVTIDLEMKDHRLAAIGHEVRGCLLCQAAMAIMIDHALGRDEPSLRHLPETVRAFLKGEREDPWLRPFHPVRQTRSRQQCVLLPFAAMEKALTESNG